MVWVDKGALAVLSDAAAAALVAGPTVTRQRVDARAQVVADAAVVASEAGEPARIASQLSSQTAARSAVDARIRTQVEGEIGAVIASNPAVTQAVIDGINADPAILSGVAYFKGPINPASTADVDDLATGSYWVTSGVTATAGGLPVAYPGLLTVTRQGGPGTATFTPVGTTSQTWQRNRTTSGGWGAWVRVDALNPAIQYYKRNLTSSDDLLELDPGIYSVTGPGIADYHGLPTSGSGALEVIAWGVARIHVWRPRVTAGGPEEWQQAYNNGQWSEWGQIGQSRPWYQGSPQLATHIDDESLPSGVYTIWSGAHALAMGLPTSTYGVYERYRFSTTGGIDVWRTSGSLDPTEVWQRIRVSGVWRPWMRIDAQSTGAGRVTLWGSSTPALAYGVFQETLAPFDIAVAKLASGGEVMRQTAARIGAEPVTLTVAGGQIPASGTVTVSGIPGTPANLLATDGWLEGVYGRLSGDTDGYTFTRHRPGSSVTVSGASWEPDVKTPAHLNILAAGKNSLSSGATTGERADVIAARDAIVSYWHSLGQKVLILGHFVNNGTPASSAARTAIEADNADAATKYPDEYLSMQDVASDPRLWDFTGITPTSEDLAQQALGNLPPSVNNGNHFTAAGAEFLAWRVAEWMREKNHVGKGRIPFSA